MTLCDSLSELAESTWAHMAYQVNKGYRLPDERAFTDHHLVELSIRHPSEVQAKVFRISDEARSGADFELWFAGSSKFVGALVQAKKMDQNAYGELDAVVGKKVGAPRQIDTLVRACAPGTGPYAGWEPLYLFYNGPTTSRAGMPQQQDQCGNAEVGPMRRGCTFARAGAVKTVLDSIPGAPHKKLADIGPLGWPWQCLVCCPNTLQGPLPIRVSHLLSGAVGSQGHVVQSGAAPKIWEFDEVPRYVQLMSGRDAPGEVALQDKDRVPGANRVVLITG